MKKIFVYLESHKDGLKRSSFELISAAKRLAESSGAAFSGIVIGGADTAINLAAEYGLSEVIRIKHDRLAAHSSTAYAEAIAQAFKSANGDVLLISANAAGLEMAPRLAVKLSAGYVSDCVALDFANGELIAKKPVYAGKALIKTKVDTDVKVFSLRPNVFTAVKADSPASLNISDFAPSLEDKHFGAKVVNLAKNEGKLDVLEADIIVSGGRGIKGGENYHLIEELAAALGGAVGASRAVVDSGWRPHNEQVGQTGKTVSPNLYVACAISGAVQHLAGMSSSKYIVAINKDKDAPIFKACDYGIVGDIFTVLPKLTETIKSKFGK